jgi:hypothetical protein
MDELAISPLETDAEEVGNITTVDLNLGVIERATTAEANAATSEIASNGVLLFQR